MELGVGSTPPGKWCCHLWKYVKILFAIFAELPNGAAPIPRCLYVNKIYWTSCQKLPSTRKSYGRVSQNWSCGSKNIARIANAQSGSTKLYWAFIFLWLGRSSLDPTLFPPKRVHSSSERHLLVRFPALSTFEKGNLIDICCLVRRALTWTRLGQPDNQTSGWHWATCYH